jgi:hypothetical protein
MVQLLTIGNYNFRNQVHHPPPQQQIYPAEAYTEVTDLTFGSNIGRLTGYFYWRFS